MPDGIAPLGTLTLQMPAGHRFRRYEALHRHVSTRAAQSNGPLIARQRYSVPVAYAHHDVLCVGFGA